VGIGTTNPQARLHIGNTAGTWTNSHLGVVLSSQLGSCWRMDEPTETGVYLGFGMTDLTSVPGWYWIASANTDNTLVPKYPMILTIDNSGKGLLTVNGKIHTREEITVDYHGTWYDYIFAENYKLMTLPELENYILLNKHLPDIPSADEVKENGIKLAEMNTLLLKKIEELTLYVIELEKQNKEFQKKFELLEKK
jgi:hypothetical protein